MVDVCSGTRNLPEACICVSCLGTLAWLARGNTKSAIMSETRQQAGCQWYRFVSINDMAPRSFFITDAKALGNDRPA